jgi:hypothetical protein
MRARIRCRFLSLRPLLVLSLLFFDLSTAGAEPDGPQSGDRMAKAYHLPPSSGLSSRDAAMQRALEQSLNRSAISPILIGPDADWAANGRAILAVRPSPLSEGWELDLKLERRTDDGRWKSGEMFTRLPVPLDLARQPWRVSGEIWVPRDFLGTQREEYLTPMRARWVARDARGRRCYGPNGAVSLLVDQWVAIPPMVPTVAVPMPKGLVEEGFDPSSVVDIGFNIEAGNIPQSPEIVNPPKIDYVGTVRLRHVLVEPLPFISPAESAPEILFPSPRAEAEAAPALWTQLRERLGVREGEMELLVNVAWPFRRNKYHAYGTSLGRAPWGDHWGFSSPPTLQALRDDLKFAKAHGIRIVRVFLFGDLRTGLEFDERGKPVGFTPLVERDMAALLAAIRDEEMLMIPSLLDFLVADGGEREGPRLVWKVGERPDLLTDPELREALINVLVRFVREFNSPEVLAWEIMNEPDNGVAVTTPEHFNSLRQFIGRMAVELRGAGVLTTAGFRHHGDYQRFWRGYVDVPQVHHWRLLESVENPYPIDTPAAALSPLPCIMGEMEPVRDRDVASLLDRMQKAGFLISGFWSLRGHDGFAFRPIAAAVKTWVDAQRRLRRTRASAGGRLALQ